jgi:hypothetical protein
MQSRAPWRGYVNQLTYGLDLGGPVADEVVKGIADALIRQRSYLHAVPTYYDAATAALASSVPTAQGPGEDATVRDFLTRLLRALDARRPWPEPLFRRLGSGQWTSLADAPVIGRIPLSRLSVGNRLNGIFEPVDVDGKNINVFILRLRSGEVVGLVAGDSFTEPGVLVRAQGDQQVVLDALRAFTGLEAAPL